LEDSLGVRHVVVTNSGTSALTMALIALDIGPGDSVMVPDITWIATAQAVNLVGADVISIDTLPGLPIMDINLLESKMSSSVKAIIPVHMNGRSVDMISLKKYAEDKNVHLIEDACKAMFSRNQVKNGEGYLGTLGDMGCFSMGMISLVPAAYGGFIVTNNSILYEKLKVIRWHGVAYNPKEVYVSRASNFKYSDLLSSMAISQLNDRDSKIKKLNNIYSRYKEGLSGLSFINLVPVDIEAGEIPLLNDVRSLERDSVVDYLKRFGIETCNFHAPIHEAPYLNCQGEFKNSKVMSNEAFHLPCGPDQKTEEIDYCIEILRQYKRY
jgi:perosamine synthetase